MAKVCDCAGPGASIDQARERRQRKKDRKQAAYSVTFGSVIVLTRLQLDILKAYRRPVVEVVEYEGRSGERLFGAMERPVDSETTPAYPTWRDATGKPDWDAMACDDHGNKPSELSEDDRDAIATTAARAGALMRMRRWEADRAAAVA